MPIIKSSADLRNSYNEISNLCHQYNEPVFTTKNGKGNLTVMSIEAFDQLFARLRLYNFIQEGLQAVADGRSRPLDEAMADIIKSKHRQ